MESIVKKYQQMYRKVKNEMGHWEELQSLLVSQFSNACSMIQMLPVLRNSKNYGVLNSIPGIEDAVLAKQMESLQTVFDLMNKTMEDFRGVVVFLEKIVRDSKQLIGAGSARLSDKQVKQRIGIKPTLADCLDGLKQLEEMHRSEYLLKVNLVSQLSDIALKHSATAADATGLRQLLVDQPNLPQEEVQFIFDIIFAEDISY